MRYLRFVVIRTTVIFCYPEPSGLSLEEIQEIYKYGFGIRKSSEIRAAHKVARQKHQSQERGAIQEGV